MYGTGNTGRNMMVK